VTARLPRMALAMLLALAGPVFAFFFVVAFITKVPHVTVNLAIVLVVYGLGAIGCVIAATSLWPGSRARPSTPSRN